MISESAFQKQITEAFGFVRQRWDGEPYAGIILGTGSGKIADEIEVENAFAYSDIPNFPSSTAIGHKGRLVCGKLAGRSVIGMQGRFHLYEGYSIEKITLPVHVMQRFGIKTLLISNAAGGVNPKYALGEIMVINSHIDFHYRTTPTFLNHDATDRLRHPNRIDGVYCPKLANRAMQIGRHGDFVVHSGVYVGMQGPTYETRAEYRMIRRIGGDAAGMSTIPEVSVAARYQIPTLAASIITNVARPDALKPTSGQEVIDAAESAAGDLRDTFVEIVAG